MPILTTGNAQRDQFERQTGQTEFVDRNDRSALLQYILNLPHIQEQMGAQQRAADAARAALGAGRSAARQQRAIRKKQLQFQLRTGLRDIEQGREEGLQGAINNALQRGIFRSGILTENQQKVERESNEASSDLQTQIKLALDALRAQGAGQEASFDAQKAQFDAATAPQLGDLASIAMEGQFTNPTPPDAPVLPSSEPEPRTLPPSLRRGGPS